MIIKVTVNNFDELMEHSWSGAVDNLKLIDKYGLQDEFMQYLDDIFCDCEPTDTTVNDAIWFMDDINEWIAEHIDFDDIEDIDELEQYVKDLGSYEAGATITDFKCADKEDILWKFLQNNYEGESLLEVIQRLEGFEAAEDFEAEEE